MGCICAALQRRMPNALIIDASILGISVVLWPNDRHASTALKEYLRLSSAETLPQLVVRVLAGFLHKSNHRTYRRLSKLTAASLIYGIPLPVTSSTVPHPFQPFTFYSSSLSSSSD